MVKKLNIKSKLKRIVPATVALAMTATTFSTFSVAAEQQNVVYPYAIFAVQDVKINTEGFTLNGNAYSKGDFVYTSKNALKLQYQFGHFYKKLIYSENKS